MLRKSLDVCWNGRSHERAMLGPCRPEVSPCVTKWAIGTAYPWSIRGIPRALGGRRRI